MVCKLRTCRESRRCLVLVLWLNHVRTCKLVLDEVLLTPLWRSELPSTGVTEGNCCCIFISLPAHTELCMCVRFLKLGVDYIQS